MFDEPLQEGRKPGEPNMKTLKKIISTLAAIAALSFISMGMENSGDITARNVVNVIMLALLLACVGYIIDGIHSVIDRAQRNRRAAQ
jgi:hypothetical protein